MTATENVTTGCTVIAATLGLISWWVLVRRDTRPKTPAGTNTANWSLKNWPVCEGAHCRFPGTNHIVWTKNNTEGDLCPGCRDKATARKLARDAWHAA